MDELMMDWLYDELDPSSSARVAEHVGACARCSAEMGALRRTREAFRDLSDLEPPPSVSAILLHEAARRAPATAAATAGAASSTGAAGMWSWLGSLLRPLVLHPAATAVATLILVAGVAGTLYVRRGAEMAKPSARTAASEVAASKSDAPVAAPPADPASPAGATAAAPAADPPLDEAYKLSRESESKNKGDGIAADLLDGDQQAELQKAQDKGEADEGAGEAEKKSIAAKRAVKSAEANGARADRSPPRQKIRATRPPEEAANAVSGAGPRAAEPQPAQAAGGAGTGAATTPASPPADQSAVTTDARDAVDRGYAEPPLSKQDASWLQSQELKLGALVKGKRCREAAAIANDILDRNPGYYARRVRDSKQVEPCRWYVGDEQRRRASRRAQTQAPASTSKTKAGGAQKARAAPEKDEAAADQSRQ